MASITISGNDGPLTINNLPLNMVDRASVTADTMIAGGYSNTQVLTKVSKFQTQIEDSVDIPTQQVVGKTSKKAPTKKAPAVKAAPATGAKTKRAKGANNAKRTKALEMFTSLTAYGHSQESILKAVMTELSITYANAYYYYSRVFKKA